MNRKFAQLRCIRLLKRFMFFLILLINTTNLKLDTAVRCFSDVFDRFAKLK